MPRSKRGFRGRLRRTRVLKQAEGFSSARGRLMRTAMEAVDKALKHAYVGRKLKKRSYRGLWQMRISAAAKGLGLSYSKMLGNLKKKSVEIDRKMLAEIALHHPEDFAAIVEWAKNA